ncbi:GNAT family N-acetyltransferase [Mediterraneibacter glycyrrhizinilyticus]|nr:GNAT family N-acetyltransferase [Mediterraneibacter glycyrrhizinilyticus]MBM6855367.1 GNAT family N-acetyltransferase [Mediterraneibacter glycyrrhizinilyticus]
MKKTEYPLLKEFLYEAIYVPEGAVPPDRSSLETPELQVYLSGFGESESDCAVAAEVRGKIIGAAWARIMNDYGHIDDETPSIAISVYKEYRGQGIGKKLLLSLLSALQDKGVRRVSLSVQKANPAGRLYQRIGFTTVKETEEEYIMARSLFMSVNGKEYKIRNLLGRGKGGYS